MSERRERERERGLQGGTIAQLKGGFKVRGVGDSVKDYLEATLSDVKGLRAPWVARELARRLYHGVKRFLL